MRPGTLRLLNGIDLHISFHSDVKTAGQQVPAGDLLIVTKVTCPWLVHLFYTQSLGVAPRDRLTSLNGVTQLMSDQLRIPDSVDAQRLAAMQLVAKMKESADRHGIGFVGDFIAPDGQKFVMTNMDDEETNMLLPEDLK